MSINESNVRVVIRVRPLSPKERLASARTCLNTIDNTSIICPPDKTFHYDAVLEQSSSQTDVFEITVAPFIGDFLEGFNCSILAYGQTGSGKTYTMGTMSTTDGIIPRTINRVIRGIRRDGRQIETADIYVSFAEIYNEEVHDLLDPRGGKRIGIREDMTGDIVLTGVKEERIAIATESDESLTRAILAILHQGALGRTTKSTAMNHQSSRSHAIFTLTLRQTRNSAQLVSKLHFVDLAGSERLKRTGAEGERAREGIAINGGLLALGNVISALSDPHKRALHIPYRDSKLTRLLQDSLGGNSKTVMIACVSPADVDLNETVNTLRYAQRARNIKNRAQVNTELPGSTATMFEVLQLRKQVAALKSELLHARGGGDVLGQRSERGGAELGRKASHSNIVNAPMISGQRAAIREGFQGIEAVAAQISSLHLDLQEEDGNCGIRGQCEALLSGLRSELMSQEEMLARLQALSQEYNVMKGRFEERLLLQQEALDMAQRERDEALSRLSDPIPLDNLSRMTRQKYEDKIKRLGRELNDARGQLADSQDRAALSRTIINNDKSLHNLKQTVHALRNERQQLQERVEGLEYLMRQSASAKDGDLREARLRERKASDLAKRWKRAYEFQKGLLLKRSEQCSIARSKVQTLLTVLRRKSLKSPSISRVIDLNSPSWRKLMASDADIPGRFEGEDGDPPRSPTRKPTRESMEEEGEDGDVPMAFVSSGEIVNAKAAPLLPPRHGGSLSRLQ